MALGHPPAGLPLRARVRVLQRGTPLYRVTHSRRAPNAFKPALEEHQESAGGRFDRVAKEDGFSVLYAASTPETAVAESLLRGRSFPRVGRSTAAGRGHSRAGGASET